MRDMNGERLLKGASAIERRRHKGTHLKEKGGRAGPTSQNESCENEPSALRHLGTGEVREFRGEEP